MMEKAAGELREAGVLTAGVNMANSLLVTGEARDGEPDGVAPDMAREAARRLGVRVRFIRYATPGETAAAAAQGEWDFAVLAVDPERAEAIAFSEPFVVVEATYLVRADSPVTGVDDIDRPGLRIAISGGSAYDLFLSRQLSQATLERGRGPAGALELFRERKLEALAGLRPWLKKVGGDISGGRVLPDAFTTIGQAVATPKGRPALAAVLAEFVTDARKSGLVAELIARHGVAGKLTVA